MRYLPLLLLAACAHGPIPTVHPTDRNVRRVEHAYALMPAQWERSPWYRAGDLTLDYPVYLVVAGDNTACIVSGYVWAGVKRGDAVACATSWRIAR